MESDYKKLSERFENIRLNRNKVKFTLYQSDAGKVKLVIKNVVGQKVKSMAYVIKGGKQSLLEKRNGEALGIIVINLEGYILEEPKSSNTISILQIFFIFFCFLIIFFHPFIIYNG